jgi:hypothetical protein
MKFQDEKAALVAISARTRPSQTCDMTGHTPKMNYLNLELVLIYQLIEEKFQQTSLHDFSINLVAN